MAPALDEIAKDVQRLADALSTNEPTASDWINWTLTLIGIVASTFVGFIAWNTSREATKIADIGLRQEAARDRDAYDHTITKALSSLIMAIADHGSDIHTWVRTADELESRPGFSGDDEEYPDMPSTARVTGHLEAASMLARDTDRGALRKISIFISAVRKAPPTHRERWLRHLVIWIRKWRDGTWSTSVFEDELESKTADVKAGKGQRVTTL